MKIRLHELKEFCNSRMFRESDVKPISSFRVISYLANPRAKREDIVLYVLHENDRIIAFRTVFADEVFPDDESIRFGWCSGVWVRPDFRGKRLWKILLDEALSDWNGCLMFTNYAANIPTLYCRSEDFYLLRKRIGLRFYLYPDLYSLLKGRIRLPRLVLAFGSYIIRCVTQFKQLFNKSLSVIDYEEFDSPPDDSCLKVLNEKVFNSLYRRSEKELSWIFSYPWVTKDSVPDFVYPFSFSCVNYKIRTVKILSDKKESGFFIYSIRDRHMKLLYYYLEDRMISGMIRIVSSIAIQNRISHLTILEADLAWRFKKESSCFAFSGKYGSDVYSSFPVKDECYKIIFDGDGDNCFT